MHEHVSSKIHAPQTVLRAGLLLLAMLIALVLPHSASADVVETINFDALATGAMVADQFTAEGVVFVDDSTSTGEPEVRDVGAGVAGSGSNVAMSTCSGCEFTRHVVRANFSTTVGSVSANIGANPDVCSWSVSVAMFAYAADGTLIDSMTAPVGFTSYATAFTVTDPSGHDIAYVLLGTDPLDGQYNGCSIGFDDFAFSKPDTAPPADVAISTPDSVVSVRQGATTDIEINITRVNGSTGNLDFVAAGLPSGVTASFSPDPATGTSTTTTLTLTAAAGAAEVLTPDSFTVYATPASAAVAPSTRTINISTQVLTNFYVSIPETIEVPSCGTGSVNAYVNRTIGFDGTVSLEASALPSGFTTTITPNTSTPSGSGALATPHAVAVSVSSTGSLGDQTMTLTGSATGLAASTDTTTVRRVAGSISAVEPSVVYTPSDRGDGTMVTIRGSGLCPGSTVQFGSTGAFTPSASSFASDGTSVTVEVPRDATTGFVTVTNADGTRTSPTPITVFSTRNTEGFRFENYNHPGVNFNDLKETYGEADTNLSVNPCWPWYDCSFVTPVPNPLTYLFMGIANAALSGDGSCFGISVTSQQLATGRVPFSRFTPTGADSAWELEGDSAPGATLATHIRRWHNVQLSSEFIQEYVTQMASNPARGVSHLKEVATNELNAGRHPIIVLANGFGGHVLVAYDMRDTADGGFELDVYDPNLPYLSSEESNGADRADVMARGVITMSGSGRWSHRGAYSSTWSGGLNKMMVVPFSRIPRDPTLPTSIDGLLSLIIPLADNPGTAVVTDSQGRTLTLNSDGVTDAAVDTNPIPEAGVFNTVTGDSSRPIYLVPSSVGPLNYKVKSAETGSYAQGLAGPGFVARISGIKGVKDDTDEIDLNTKTGSVTLDPANSPGSLTAELARAESKGDGQRMATIKLTGLDAGSSRFQLNPAGGGLLVSPGGGPAKVQVDLGWGGTAGRPGSISLPTVSLNRGERLVINPVSWKQLRASGVQLTVRAASGKIERTRTIRGNTSSYVRKVRAQIKTSKGTARTAIITARLGKISSDARAYANIEIRRGSKVVFKSAEEISSPSRKFKWSAPATLKKGRYRVRASLVVVSGEGTDIRSDSGTVSKQVRLR